MRERAAWKKTRGLSLTGLIMVLFITVLVFIFGMKLIPAYIEYATAKKAITRPTNAMGPGRSPRTKA